MKIRIALYCVLGGLPMLLGAAGGGSWTAFWFSGIVLSTAFVPVALFGPRRPLDQFDVIAPALLIITAVCTWSEALIFVAAPEFQQHRMQALIGSCVMYLIMAAFLAALAHGLGFNRETALKIDHRGVRGTAILVLFCGAAYLFYYLVFGALTYQFFTKGYYPEATKVVENLGLWFWLIQFGRGVVMTLAIVPILYTLRMPRWQAAIVAGLVVWIAGGLAPLLLPNPYMGLPQRMIHVAEIFTQNFTLGLTAGLLLLPRAARPVKVRSAVAQ